MKQLILEFYRALGVHEKKVFWFGGLTFSLGFCMLVDVLKPPSWFGWQVTKGEITHIQSTKKGLFSGGNVTFQIRYTTLRGQSIDALYTASPVVISTMSHLKVYYKVNEVNHFYVYNPSYFTIALSVFVFGSLVVLAFVLYHRDKQKSIDYN